MADETYKGRRISVKVVGDDTRLSIDGKAVKVTREEDGSYSSPENQFMTFGSVHELARALINQKHGI
jgi:hypothetical protein